MKRVLFLCTGNAARSQMAEGYLRALGDLRFTVFSAGIDPKGVHPLAIDVMFEDGIDIGNQVSEPLADFVGTEFDFIVTLCSSAKQECPNFPGQGNRYHWDLSDPAAGSGTKPEKLQIFRETRERIKEYVIEFINDNS